jgi:hypothetical protein
MALLLATVLAWYLEVGRQQQQQQAQGFWMWVPVVNN